MNRPSSILIGNDEPSVTDALQILLTTSDEDGEAFQFTTSSRSDEFIQQARSGRYDLAILHANCLSPTQPFRPLENALHAVKNIKTSVPLKLIAITTMDEWVAPLRASGADACLKAPFAANELLGTISVLI